MPHAVTTTLEETSLPPYLKPQSEAASVNHPDIEWLPSYDTYRARVERLAALALERPNHVPSGWPSRINAPRNWSGSEYADSSRYVVQLTEEEIAEIDEALSHFKGELSSKPMDVAEPVLMTLCRSPR